mmetsp:Transcript_25984/g.47104  ORF Transcript_25984/g.47104 Transcript_25984/m.47104 type:complete len:118 (-) Transcript_25984:137-490(-)
MPDHVASKKGCVCRQTRRESGAIYSESLWAPSCELEVHSDGGWSIRDMYGQRDAQEGDSVTPKRAEATTVVVVVCAWAHHVACLLLRGFLLGLDDGYAPRTHFCHHNALGIDSSRTT